MYQGGWRLAFLCTQVITFLIASRFDWSTAYSVAAITMAIVAVITILVVPAPLGVERGHISILNKPKAWFKTAYLTPFMDLANRYTNRIYLILLLVMSYRFSDFILGPMAMPFYRETGFTKDQIAVITNALSLIHISEPTRPY